MLGVDKRLLHCCGACGVTHHVRVQCLGPRVDKSVWCSRCDMSSNSHLKSCPKVKGVSRLCYRCKQPGHVAGECVKCPFCGQWGHEKNSPEKVQEPYCKRCGRRERLSRFCRVHHKFRESYEEMEKNDPIEQIN